MCTLSWLRHPGGYELYCSRDERLQRLPARAPEPLLAGGLRALAPVDGEAGGTWIGVNERGLTLCLLNGYPPAVPGPDPGPRAYTSRGLLLQALLGSPDPPAVARALGARPLDEFQPFLVAAFAPDRPLQLFTWDGRRLQGRAAGDGERPLVSAPAPVRPGEPSVHALRADLFGRLRGPRGAAGEPDAALLAAFHRSHGPAPGPASPCMHGPESGTVSLSRVRVDPRAVEFDYAPGPPCRTALAPAGALPRGSAA